MTTSNENIEVAKLQKQIAESLGLSLDNLVFNFENGTETITLELITINPVHEQTFLLHKTKALTKVEALQKMNEYVIENYKRENSYTVQWVKVGEDDLHTSYFRAQNIYEALDKFYYGRDLSNYNVFSVTLNPVA